MQKAFIEDKFQFNGLVFLKSNVAWRILFGVRLSEYLPNRINICGVNADITANCFLCPPPIEQKSVDRNSKPSICLYGNSMYSDDPPTSVGKPNPEEIPWRFAVVDARTARHCCRDFQTRLIPNKCKYVYEDGNGASHRPPDRKK